LLKIGDIIEFSKNDRSEKMQRQVLALLNFPDFEMLVGYLPLSLFGHADKNSVKTGVNKIYTLQQQKKYRAWNNYRTIDLIM
jgi:ASC-1-like (ASCH) protein